MNKNSVGNRKVPNAAKRNSHIAQGEVSKARKKFSRDKPGDGSVLQRKSGASCVRSRNSRIVSSKLTVHIRLCMARVIIDPEEKRAEYIDRIEKELKRLEKIINSNRTKTMVKLRAMETLAELIKTSYTMVRDEEMEKTERETQALEEEAKRGTTEDSDEEEGSNPT
jgi:Mg2+ and Co2+ transporter CorA